MHDPRQEAIARLGSAYDARVLEPSPPAVTDPPWFADDPLAGDGSGRPVVSPIPGAGTTWAELAASDPGLAAWATDRWLGPYRRLEPAPPGLEAVRRTLHELAEHTLSPARAAANGKIALRFTRGGFGTPFFGADEQLRVEGTTLVTLRDGREEATPIAVDAACARAIAAWFGFAASVLEELRAEAPEGSEPSRVQLWPEHFDLAVELGAEAGRARAAYGCAPGDDLHPEPYCYVAPWTPQPVEPLWNATAFRGAELPYADLLAAGDQRAEALTFFRARLGALAA